MSPRSNELSQVAKAYLDHGPLTDRGVSDITGIQKKNIPRSRIKLWYLDYVTTDDFETFYLTEVGKPMATTHILFPFDFMEAGAKFRKAKRQHHLGHNQQVFFNED